MVATKKHLAQYEPGAFFIMVRPRGFEPPTPAPKSDFEYFYNMLILDPSSVYRQRRLRQELYLARDTFGRRQKTNILKTDKLGNKTAGNAV